MISILAHGSLPPPCLQAETLRSGRLAAAKKLVFRDSARILSRSRPHSLQLGIATAQIQHILYYVEIDIFCGHMPYILILCVKLIYIDS